jgi:hypothetical protein
MLAMIMFTFEPCIYITHEYNGISECIVTARYYYIDNSPAIIIGGVFLSSQTLKSQYIQVGWWRGKTGGIYFPCNGTRLFK